jgi:hypothetical protein
MLRGIDGWDSEHFAFGATESPAAAASAIAVNNGPDGLTATIPDAHLLFTAQFSRAGADLILQGEDGKVVAVHDYFATDARARLLSPEGAALSPDVVAALAGPLAPGQFAQAGATQVNAQAVGRVAQVEGGATIIRNGVAMQANTGDAILKGDVLQTVTGSLGVTFNDGSTLNITANSRLVVNEFVYDPRGSQNSQLLDLVQGSLTFISGEVAHSGDMKIGTPVATMGIRGTVGGVTTANDGTVRFYVSQSATGAVILDSRGTIIANVVQDGPLIVVRPVGPLQVLAEELQKSPAQLATELAALQHIVSVKSVGDQLIQQFFQQNPTNNPNPQSTDHPHTQIPDTQIDLKPDPLAGAGNNNDGNTPPVIAIVTPPPSTPGTPLQPDPAPIVIPIPVNLPPINFGPLNAATGEDQTLTFAGQSAISVFDADTGILKVTLSATHGILTLSSVAGLTFAPGDSNGAAAMTFLGTQAAINAALGGLQFTPTHDYSGPASIIVQTTDGVGSSSTTVPITISPVNDAPVLDTPAALGITYAQGTTPPAVDAAITIDDVDSPTLVGAIVRITNFHNGDLLNFADQGGIHGDWNSATGVLTLSGAASVADYQAALRSVTFSNAVSNPSLDQRTVSFRVDDGGSTNHQSNTITAMVDIVPAPQAPTLIILRDMIITSPSSTILLGIAVVGHSLADDLSVTISGFSDGDHLRNLFGETLTIVNGSITLTPLQLIGLSLSAGSESIDHLTVTAYNTHNGAIAATAPQTLTVTLDEPPHAVSDNVITNVATGTAFDLPDWVLLQNDTDADHGPSPLAITNVNHSLSLNASHQGDTVYVTDKTTLLDFFGKGGSFDYTVSDGLVTDSGHVQVSVQTGSQLNGTGNADILVGRASGSTINGNGGNDILIGGNHNDTLVGGAGSDTFVFKAGFGHDTITDFAAATDYLSFDHSIFADVVALLEATTDHGTYTVITFDANNTVTLNDVNKADLQAHADHILIA